MICGETKNYKSGGNNGEIKLKKNYATTNTA